MEARHSSGAGDFARFAAAVRSADGFLIPCLRCLVRCLCCARCPRRCRGPYRERAGTMAEDATSKTVEEGLDAEIDVADDSTAGTDNLSESQKKEAEEFARDFLTRVLRLRGVKIDREHFLHAELHRRGIGDAMIARAIAENPAAAGIEPQMLDRIAAEAVEFETRKSTAMSFAAGLPGGFAMLGTIPGVTSLSSTSTPSASCRRSRTCTGGRRSSRTRTRSTTRRWGSSQRS